MPSHFSTIGFSIENPEDIHAIVDQVTPSAEKIPCEGGHYLKWSDGNGAELWLQIDSSDGLVGITPSFTGESEMVGRITHAVARPDDTLFEGAIHAWAQPDGKDLTNLIEYPFVFDLVDKAVYDDFKFPFVSEIALAAFAHELTIYDSEQDYLTRPTDEPKFAIRSFFPTGLYSNGNKEDFIPLPHALFTGVVLKTSKYVNPLTGLEYHWALVKTLDGNIDVVADPELVDRLIAVGGVITGSYWLNGKIKNPKYKMIKRFLRRLQKR